MISKTKLVPIAIALAGIVALGFYPKEEIAVPAQGNYSVAQIALEEHWIKGAAPILAANFEKVSIRNINKDVEESFVFDVALSQIYEIETDYEHPPIDIRSLELAEALEPFSKERSEVFCNNKDLKYCELSIAWDQSDRDEIELIGLRISDAHYALVELALAKKLGVSIDE